MTASEWGVILGGVALIAWIQWYFFLAERRGAGSAPGADGVREAAVEERSEG